MANQITVKWDSQFMPWDDLAASLSAIEEYRPIPDVKVSLAIKGYIDQEDLKRIVRQVEQAEGAECKVSITAVWPAGKQLRLFGPGDPAGREAVTAAEDILKGGE